jgi:hypothetical protein
MGLQQPNSNGASVTASRHAYQSGRRTYRARSRRTSRSEAHA